MALKQKIRNRQGGFIVSAELALITTILVIGLIVGLVAVRDSLVAELHDIAEAIGELDQSYNFAGLTDAGTAAQTQGSNFTDADDNIGTPAGASTGGATIGGDDTEVDYLVPDGDEGGTTAAVVNN